MRRKDAATSARALVVRATRAAKVLAPVLAPRRAGMPSVRPPSASAAFARISRPAAMRMTGQAARLRFAAVLRVAPAIARVRAGATSAATAAPRSVGDHALARPSLLPREARRLASLTGRPAAPRLRADAHPRPGRGAARTLAGRAPQPGSPRRLPLTPPPLTPRLLASHTLASEPLGRRPVAHRPAAGAALGGGASAHAARVGRGVAGVADGVGGVADGVGGVADGGAGAAGRRADADAPAPMLVLAGDLVVDGQRLGQIALRAAGREAEGGRLGARAPNLRKTPLPGGLSAPLP